VRTMAALALGALAIGCAPASRTVEGTIRAEGTAARPRTSIVADGGRTTLIGALEPELRRVAGATVRVSGVPSSDAPGDALRVRGYRILSIDGDRPWVGTVTDRGETMELSVEGREPGALTLAGLPAGSITSGARAWFVGRREGTVLRVRSYGVLRPPGPD